MQAPCQIRFRDENGRGLIGQNCQEMCLVLIERTGFGTIAKAEVRYHPDKLQKVRTEHVGSEMERCSLVKLLTNAPERQSVSQSPTRYLATRSIKGPNRKVLVVGSAQITRAWQVHGILSLAAAQPGNLAVSPVQVLIFRIGDRVTPQQLREATRGGYVGKGQSDSTGDEGGA